MKYLTTLEVAQRVNVSKQTLLNWLYAGRVPEPPRNKKGYRLWSAARLKLVQKLIEDGHLKKRTILHRQPSNRSDIVVAFAREVHQFLCDGKVDVAVFFKELSRLNPEVAAYSQGMSGIKRRSTARPPRK